MKRASLTRQLCIVGVLIVAFLGCDRELTTPATAPVPVTPPDTVERVARISIFGMRAPFRVGDSVQLGAVVLNQTGNVMAGQRVQWTSSNAAVASVTEQGLVQGNGIGSTYIRAAVGHTFSEVVVNIAETTCTQATGVIKIGETVSGSLGWGTPCSLMGEPADGWRFDLTGPLVVRIDLTFSEYFAHLVLTDEQLRPIAQAYRNTATGVTLSKDLTAGTYIAWVGADGDDGAYQLTINAVQSAARIRPGDRAARNSERATPSAPRWSR